LELQKKIRKTKERVEKYDSWLALLTWAPFVGDIFAIGLGFYKINFIKCSIFMLIGKALRFGLWVILYIIYGQKFLDFISNLWI
jgi:Predicted membrane protein